MENYDDENCPIKFWNVEEWRYITKKSVPNIVDEKAYMVSSFGRFYSNITNKFLTPVATWNEYNRISLMLTKYNFSIFFNS